jgi:hypothetical protein
MALQRLTGRDGSLNYKDTSTGFFIHSQFDPNKESDRLLNSLSKDTANYPMVVFGLGAAYFLDSVLRNPKYISKEIYIFEPESSLASDSELKKKFLSL